MPFLLLSNDFKQIEDWYEISEEDSEEWQILEDDIANFEQRLSEFELVILLNGPYDTQDVLLEIHAGSGGTEAQDWGRYALSHVLTLCSKK